MYEPVEISSLADFGSCVKEVDLRLLPKDGREFAIHHIHFGFLSLGNFYPIAVGRKGEEKRMLLADTQTGTTYDPVTLEGITAPLHLVDTFKEF